MEQKNLQLERMVFFCDAVVAIAITLLAFNLKISDPLPARLHFSDIFHQWKAFAAFSLSFINIANFWKTHHWFFSYIKKIDDKLLWYNVLWLLFIVILPFSTTLVSDYLFDTPAIFIYSLNILAIATFQNLIWDYPSFQSGFLKDESIEKDTISQIQLFCNLDMINAGIALIISFFYPLVAFIVLFTKFPIIIIITLFYRHKMGERFRGRRGK